MIRLKSKKILRQTSVHLFNMSNKSWSLETKDKITVQFKKRFTWNEEYTYNEAH